MKYLPHISRLAVVAIAVAVTAALRGAASAPPRDVTVCAFRMGTIVSITAPAASEGERTATRRAVSLAMHEIGRIERIFSAYRPSSELTRVNGAPAGIPFAVSAEFHDVLRKTLDGSRATDGAFDVTVKPLIDLWRDSLSRGSPPAAADLNIALARIGWRHLELNDRERTVTFAREGMGIDLGGVVKGYAADRAARVLENMGIKHAIIDIGGDMRLIGGRPDGRAWQIGVRHPRHKGRLGLRFLVRDGGVDTSGDYERFVDIEQKRYSHIIDPRTGYPIGGDTVSATVIAPDSMTADIYATALSVLGGAGLDSAARAGLDAVIVFADGGRLTMRSTEGFTEKYAAQPDRL